MSHVSIDQLYRDLKNGKVEKSYILYGIDEKQIKESIEEIIEVALTGPMKELNLFKVDGSNFNLEEFKENAENLPFMSERKVMILYRAELLREKGKEKKEKDKKDFKELIEYMKNCPSHCTIIAYYVFNDKREKNRALDNLKGDICLVKVEELKGDRLYKRVGDLFKDKGVEIGKVELQYFCDYSSKDLNIIENDIDKIVSYCDGRKIKKDDIKKLLNISGTEDIFDLVDAISQGKVERAILLMNDLIFRGINEINILYMIERQFDLLLKGKVALDNRQSNEEFEKTYGINKYIAKKIMDQGRKFSYKKIKESLRICEEMDKMMKSSALSNKLALEMLLIRSANIAG